MRFRITIILMVAIGGLTAISVGTVLVVSASANIRNTLELMQGRAQQTISAIERGVAGHVAPARNLIAHMSRRVAEGSLDIGNREQLVETLSGALAPAPQIAGVVVWQPEGAGLWVTRQADGSIGAENQPRPADPRFDIFLSTIARQETINWSEPRFVEDQTFVTITGGIVRDGAFAGAIGTGVSLFDLSRFVGKDLTLDAMTAFVLYGEDKVLAHPALLDPDYAGRLSADVPLLSVEAIGDPVLAAFPNLPVVQDLPSAAEFDVRETNVNGAHHVILSRTTNAFGAVPWQIGVHVPVEAVDQQLRRLAASIAVSLGLLVFAVIAAIVLARRIARPIRAVSAAAEKIERLDLDAIRPLPRSRIRELDEQARSFNRMVGGLKWFQAYVPQTLVRRLMETGGGPAADVREAELTVMFTDIIGFTPLSENMPPADLAEMLNRHFDLLNACIETEGGTLDKFIGDATMAFWGAPEPIPDHAARACRAALAIVKAIEAREAASGGPGVRVKIALHTGPLIVGNIGAPTRMNYTVIGDTVNVCARIESLAGEFDDGRPATILVSGEVVAAAGDGFAFQRIGERMVKGRAQPVEIWRLMEMASAAS
jgi:adenylate cyclase